MREYWGQQQFGQLVRNCRTRRGITQKQLADLSTVSVRAIRDIELGWARRPRRETVRLLADGLGLTGRRRVDFESAAGRPAVSGHPKMIYDSGSIAPPAPLAGLVGRDTEATVLQDLLAHGGERLVTVTGLAGVGKTRIALETAGAFYDSNKLPVLWTSATSPERPYSAASGSGQASSLVNAWLDELFTAPSPTVGTVGEVSAMIGDRPTLLILDGYEISEVRIGRITSLLQECRELRFLITSRSPFEIPGERVLPLAPLCVPTRHDEFHLPRLTAVPSVRLLSHYVRQIQPGFRLTARNATTVAALSRHLDGIPFLLEAAASWFLVYEPEALVDWVQTDPFGFAGRLAGSPAHLDMRGLLTHAMGSLGPDERSLLERLAKAHGSWSIREAMELTGLPSVECARLIQRLLMHGLVRTADNRGGIRFAALELVRVLCSHRQLREVDS